LINRINQNLFIHEANQRPKVGDKTGESSPPYRKLIFHFLRELEEEVMDHIRGLDGSHRHLIIIDWFSAASLCIQTLLLWK
jgi:hypothetical protein